MSASLRVISLSDFKQRHTELLKSMAEDGEPLVVTVRGRGAFVVQLPEVYRRLMQGYAESQQLQMLREALEDERGEVEGVPGRPPYGP
jgi:prevent-host-death family protein